MFKFLLTVRSSECVIIMVQLTSLRRQSFIRCQMACNGWTIIHIYEESILWSLLDLGHWHLRNLINQLKDLPIDCTSIPYRAQHILYRHGHARFVPLKTDDSDPLFGYHSKQHINDRFRIMDTKLEGKNHCTCFSKTFKLGNPTVTCYFAHTSTKSSIRT